MCSTLARKDPSPFATQPMWTCIQCYCTFAMTVECVEHIFVYIWYTKHYIYCLTCTIIQLVLEPGSGLVLPEWYYVEVASITVGQWLYMVCNSTLKGTGPFDMTQLQSSTDYNNSVISRNMAGCNESCNVHSVQQWQKET